MGKNGRFYSGAIMADIAQYSIVQTQQPLELAPAAIGIKTQLQCMRQPQRGHGRHHDIGWPRRGPPSTLETRTRIVSKFKIGHDRLRNRQRPLSQPPGM